MISFGQGSTNFFVSPEKTENFVQKYLDEYYFLQVYITVHPDLHTINRKTDSLFDWLGNWGGLFDGLNLVGKHLLSNYSFYALNSKLAWLLVRFFPSSKNSKKKGKKYREREFFKKYGDNKNDPKRQNMLQNLIKSFN